MSALHGAELAGEEAEEEVLHGSAGAEVEGEPRKHWVKYQMRLIGFENMT